MLRRLLAAAAAILSLGTFLAPAAAAAFAHGPAHLDCCCPDPAMCPVVDGRHACDWKKRAAAKPVDESRPALERCPGAAPGIEPIESVRLLPPPHVALVSATTLDDVETPVQHAAGRAADAPEPPPPRR